MARRGENIYKRKDGRYEGRYVIGKKPDGKTKFGYVFGHSYIEVKNHLVKMKAEHLCRTMVREKHSKTIGQWMNYWMENELLGSVKESSYQAYKNQLHRHLLPRLGNLELAALTPGVIHMFLQELCNAGLAENTVRGVYRLLSAGMRAALEEGEICKNPCRKIRVQRGEGKEQRVLSNEEQNKLNGR